MLQLNLLQRISWLFGKRVYNCVLWQKGVSQYKICPVAITSLHGAVRALKKLKFLEYIIGQIQLKLNIRFKLDLHVHQIIENNIIIVLKAGQTQ